VNREVTSGDVAYGIARGFLPGVDSASAKLYFADVEGVDDVAAGRSTLPSLVIAHRLSTIRGADRVVVLEAGRVVEQGSPAELRAAGGHYAQLEAESERLA
jgi:ABC-type multidrug transport system fused ATPase/permease subunit